MPLTSNRSASHFWIILPVVLIILGAVTMAATSVKENMRFSEATSQILTMDRTVQVQITRTNPWGHTVSGTPGQTGVFRIESVFPAHVCRRIALYVMETNPNETGLISIEALPDSAPAWNRVYPPPSPEIEELVHSACGDMPLARLGVTFRVR